MVILLIIPVVFEEFSVIGEVGDRALESGACNGINIDIYCWGWGFDVVGKLFCEDEGRQYEGWGGYEY